MDIVEGEEDEWERVLEVNSSDPYSKAIVDYAMAWAELMEARTMGDGTSIGDVAEKSSRDADTDGITLAMYGVAVALLARFWEHGDALREWHNARHGVGADEERTVNPAVWTVKR